MKTGLVVVNYNDYENTVNFIKKVMKYNCIDKIVIVDNASTDKSVEYLKKLKNDKIEVICNDKNRGYASGINLGSKYLIEKIGPCYIIVSNTDIEIDDENDIISLINDFTDDIAVVAPVIKENGGLNRGWKIPSPWKDTLLNLPIIYRFLKKKLLFYKNDYYKKRIVEVEVVSGCFFIINSKILQKINYLDENTFLYYEENILASKLQKENYKTVIDTKISVFHNHSITIDKNITNLNKYKILKDSQLYFQSEYNNAGKSAINMLKFTSKITFLLLKIRNFLKK